MRHNRRADGARLLAAALLLGAPHAARAEIAISSNDGHTVLDAKHAQVAPDPVRPDTVSVIDMAATPPRVTATVDVPGSVVGPPTAVWVAADESWAIVTSATKAQDDAPAGIAPDDRVSVLDLTANPPRVVQQVTAGAGATTVRVAPDGRLALVCNRTEGTVSVFTVDGKRLTPAGKVDLGKASGPSGLVFARGGAMALVSRNYDHQIAVLHIDGAKVTVDKRPITTGLAPYTMDVTPAGTLAAVANMGRGDGDIDTVSLIDLVAEPPRVVETASVGLSPEGLKLSPDGRFLAIAAQNGTTRPPGSPFLREQGRLILFAIEPGPRLRQVAEAPIGRWSQGIAFARDGRTVLVQNMVERTIAVFGFDGTALAPLAPIAFVGVGPAAIGTPWP
jgi:DNA-binding beta-propeller fold protein YncE